MTNEEGRYDSGEQQWLDELGRVQYDVYEQLAECNIADQLVDVDTKGEHYRCVNYINGKYTELLQELPQQPDWAELSADGRGDANTAMVAANLYRFEKIFQDSMITSAIITRCIMEKLQEQLERGIEVDKAVFWNTTMDKKQHQIIFDLFYDKQMTNPWQRFYHDVTSQFEQIDMTNIDDVALFVQTENSKWHFEEVGAAHNMILREAAEHTGLFKIQDDPDMLVRLATILVETQMIAMRDREQGVWSDDIKEYGQQWNVGDKLIETLSTLYRERYLQD